ncbi:MAG TPA: PQQ-binding-like beta-propeller repeat protein [Prolixibacteraceae bacterium]|nr:PQQ-binding-like beta-propeller repeat protein [Prolixibacteraceae bacterium]
MKPKSSLIFFFFFCAFIQLNAQDRNEQFWNAARANDTLSLKRWIDEGMDVNTANHYGVTALSFAIDKGHQEAVRFLLEHGANPDLKDSFYGETPLGWAIYRKNPSVIKTLIDHGADLSNEYFVLGSLQMGLSEIALYMIEKGAPGAEKAAQFCIKNGDVDLFEKIFPFCRMDEQTLSSALVLATSGKHETIIAVLKQAGARLPEKGDDDPVLELNENMTGDYLSAELSKAEVSIQDAVLMVRFDGSPLYPLKQKAGLSFEFAEFPGVEIIFEEVAGQYVGMRLLQNEQETKFTRKDKEADRVNDRVYSEEDDSLFHVGTPINWASFRGNQASGLADGQHPPVTWDIHSPDNLRWKTYIPGLSHASPVIWGNRIFIVTAVGRDTTAEYRVGLFGDVDPADDDSPHEWKIFCLDKAGGQILWERKAYEGVPRVKRHIKGTQANATPVTNGEYVVALFGSEGLVCYDTEGNEIWRNDLGVLDAGWFYNDDTQWGPASSPIIYKNTVVVQCDRSKNSFIAAFDLKTGEERWNTPRDEISSWGTPTIFYGDRDELITHATRYIRAYNPETGEELWRLKPNSEITVATPIIMDSLIFITAGYPPVSPVYAILPGGSGDISIPDSLNSGKYIKWRTLRGGTYMPTPVAYQSFLYTLANNGVLCCYDALTGERKYREAIKNGGAFTASPIAADGKIYCTSEQKGVFVIHAGGVYELIANNPINEICMATPAISDGLIFIRGQHHLFCIGRKR